MTFGRESSNQFYGDASGPPFQRRLLLIAADALLLPLAVWLSFWLRLAHPLHTSFLKLAGGCLPAIWIIAFLSTPLAVITRAIYSLCG